MNRWNEFKQWIEDQDKNSYGLVVVSVGTIQKKMHELECAEVERQENKNMCMQCLTYKYECTCEFPHDLIEIWEAEAAAYQEVFRDKFIKV